MSSTVEETRRRLGRVGVFGTGIGGITGGTIDEERRYVAALDRLGYGSLWVGETIGGKDIFARLGVALAETERLVVGSGIANVWARHPRTTHAAAATLAEAYPGRFVLGVGIGSPAQAELTGREFQRPLRQLRDYVAGMDAPVSEGYAETPSPAASFPRVLAAVGPKMLALAAELTDGAHPFVQPVEHTARAREILGPDKLLVPQLGVMLTGNRAETMEKARTVIRMISGATAYANSWRRFGLSEQEIADASPRAADAILAVGDEAAIAARVREHLDAGADHVLVTPMVPTVVDALAQLEKLAPALLDDAVVGV